MSLEYQMIINPQKDRAASEDEVRVNAVVIKPGDIFVEDTGEKWTAKNTVDQHNIYAESETGDIGIFCAVGGCELHDNLRVL